MSLMLGSQEINSVDVFKTGGGGGEVNPRYKLVTKTPQLSSVTIEGVATNALTAQVDDFAINTIQLTGDTYPLFVYMPEKYSDGTARDFCVRVECLAAAPTIGFFGSGSESCDFESVDDDWEQLETGANLFNFTETKQP